MMTIDKYYCLYPSTLVVVHLTKDNMDELIDHFTFYKRTGDLQCEKFSKEEVSTFLNGSLEACVYSAMDNETNDYCVLVIIKSDSDLISTACHEAVHVADYYFQLCGMYTNDFSDGDEHYAYLVQWCFECICKSIDKWKKV